ncbi:hypothetical protein B296_00048012 [Ensete ventricosum]|uniref:Glutaredoxin domain-containing protein n=1 Tax=Ensete ventricosum TaxID=4639 RepID=A0A426XIB2_ENSVE|nr:hypothetical protein B296_00048012 [Ensete ventricosum]
MGPTTTMDALERVERLAAESAVVIFSVSTCCMCHAVKRLFCGMGVSPSVVELDEDPRGWEMERALARLVGGGAAGGPAVPVGFIGGGGAAGGPAVPVVFIGGKLVGAMDRVMAAHISGALVPLLKQAGALWL